MKRRTTIAESRMTEWAMVQEDISKRLKPHDPASPSESIEYKIMMLGQVTRGGKVSDGGMFRSYVKERHNVAIAERHAEVSRVIARMERVKPDQKRVLMQAFLDKPGHICDTRIGAQELDISQNKYLKLYGEGMSFIEGALDKIAA